MIDKWISLFFKWRLMYTVKIPNSVVRILLFIVSTRVRLLYIRSKIFFYLDVLSILLFQTMYYWSFSFDVFIVKLPVYEKYPRPTELGGTSLITTASKKISLIIALLTKYMEKFSFTKKTIFSCFWWEMEGRCLRHFCRADPTLSYSKGSRQLYFHLLRCRPWNEDTYGQWRKSCP
jgi:hypothetical protein